jgi:Amt family ammonium transporter
MVLFILFVYTPLCHMTWHVDVISSKWAFLISQEELWYRLGTLAGAMFLGLRKTQKSNPARITYVLLGTGLLWFGWFGFNAGSALAANGLAVQALGTTTVAAAAANGLDIL